MRDAAALEEQRNNAPYATMIEPPRIEAGSDTAHTDDVPHEIVDIGGVMAAPVRSFFQIDAVALRLVLPATWSRRSSSAIAWIENVAW